MVNQMPNCNTNFKDFKNLKSLKARDLPMRAELPGLTVSFVPEGEVSTE